MHQAAAPPPQQRSAAASRGSRRVRQSYPSSDPTTAAAAAVSRKVMISSAPPPSQPRVVLPELGTTTTSFTGEQALEARATTTSPRLHSRHGGGGRQRSVYPASPPVATQLFATDNCPTVSVRANGTLTLSTSRHPQHYVLFPYPLHSAKTSATPMPVSRPSAPTATFGTHGATEKPPQSAEEKHQHQQQQQEETPAVSTTSRDAFYSRTAAGAFVTTTTTEEQRPSTRSTALVAPLAQRPLSTSLRWRFLTSAALGKAHRQRARPSIMDTVPAGHGGGGLDSKPTSAATRSTAVRGSALYLDAPATQPMEEPQQQTRSSSIGYDAAPNKVVFMVPPPQNNKEHDSNDDADDDTPVRTDEEDAHYWWSNAAIARPMHPQTVAEEMIPAPRDNPMVMPAAAPSGPAESVARPVLLPHPGEREALRSIFGAQQRVHPDTHTVAAQQQTRETWVADALQAYMPIVDENNDLNGKAPDAEALPPAFQALVQQEAVERAILFVGVDKKKTRSRRRSTTTSSNGGDAAAASSVDGGSKKEGADEATTSGSKPDAAEGDEDAAAEEEEEELSVSDEPHTSELTSAEPATHIRRRPPPPTYAQQLESALVALDEEANGQLQPASGIPSFIGRPGTALTIASTVAGAPNTSEDEGKIALLVEQFDALLLEAADALHYEGEERERLFHLADTLPETGVQRVYQMQHPLTDVVLSPIDPAHEIHKELARGGGHRKQQPRHSAPRSGGGSAAAASSEPPVPVVTAKMLPINEAFQRRVDEQQAHEAFVVKLKYPPGVHGMMPTAASAPSGRATVTSDATTTATTATADAENEAQAAAAAERLFLFSPEVDRRLLTPMVEDPRLQGLLRDQKQALKDMAELKAASARSMQEALGLSARTASSSNS